MLQVNCDTNSFIRCLKGVIRLLIIFDTFEDEGFSIVVGVHVALNDFESGLSDKGLGVSRKSSSLLSGSSLRSQHKMTKI